MRPAWKSRNAPTEKKPDAMMGTIQGILGAAVQPKKNMDICRDKSQTVQYNADAK